MNQSNLGNQNDIPSNNVNGASVNNGGMVNGNVSVQSFSQMPQQVNAPQPSLPTPVVPPQPVNPVNVAPVNQTVSQPPQNNIGGVNPTSSAPVTPNSSVSSTNALQDDNSKGKGNNLILTILVGVLLFAIGVGLGYFLFNKFGPSRSNEAPTVIEDNTVVNNEETSSIEEVENAFADYVGVWYLSQDDTESVSLEIKESEKDDTMLATFKLSEDVSFDDVEIALVDGVGSLLVSNENDETTFEGKVTLASDSITIEVISSLVDTIERDTKYEFTYKSKEL